MGLPVLRLLDALHRWTGGLIGLILGLLGFSGALLVHRDWLVWLPHVADARVTDFGKLAEATARLMADPARKPLSIQYASDSFGLDRVTFGEGAGAYADQAGNMVASWDSQWSRPELWLFDFHHHLFAGDTGEFVIGVAALCGLFFVISGAILWWRTRRTYSFRLLPRRLSRPAIVRHHRDLGIMVAPLLFLSLYTGSVFVFRPLAALALGPGIEAEIARSGKMPDVESKALGRNLDWRALIATAHRRFPDAALRALILPRKDSGLITVRMRQPEEWLPNGRTTLWFSADTGVLVDSRDARSQSGRVRAYNNLLYPLHAAKIGGIVFRIVMTVSGLALGLLGTLAVWSFWFRGGRKMAPASRPA